MYGLFLYTLHNKLYNIEKENQPNFERITIGTVHKYSVLMKK